MKIEMQALIDTDAMPTDKILQLAIERITQIRKRKYQDSSKYVRLLKKIDAALHAAK